jgi:gluconate 2-dehydrogenase gamma chain
MKNDGFDRRSFLKGSVAGGVAAALSPAAQAQAPKQPATAPDAPAAQPAGYAFLNPDEALFVEALVDHMVPADELSPKGSDIGINVFIDRALAGGWGKGDRLYLQGPWKEGTPSQGYQLPLTPAELYRTGIAAANAHCAKTHGKPFAQLGDAEREAFLLEWSGGKVSFENGPPARVFFAMLYQNVMEGMFSDPLYGGNRDKAGWKLIGFPGVIAVHYANVAKFRDRKYEVKPVSIQDMS